MKKADRGKEKIARRVDPGARDEVSRLRFAALHYGGKPRRKSGLIKRAPKMQNRSSDKGLQKCRGRAQASVTLCPIVRCLGWYWADRGYVLFRALFM